MHFAQYGNKVLRKSLKKRSNESFFLVLLTTCIMPKQVIPQRPRDLSCRAEGSRSLEAFENFADEGDPTLQCIVTRC